MQDSNFAEEEEFHVPRLNDDDPDADSDKELQVAFQSGLLKPGIFRPITAPPPRINNEEAIRQKLDEIKQTKLDWVERLDVTVVMATNKENVEEPGPGIGAEFDVHNDFQRELAFYEQAKESVIIGMRKLQEAGIKTKRPDDYFAEMAKKDDHMKKVREKLVSLQRRREAMEKNRSQQKMKKYGKQVQQAVVQERQHKKKEMLNAVKKFRKGKSDKLDFLDKAPVKGGGGSKKKTSQLQQLQQQNKLNPKRAYRNKKYGQGGRKKGSKRNTKESLNNVAGKFKRNVHSNKAKGGKNKRPGKSKRTKNKSK
ncbi:unnamed protein product [Clavelina lepadiformis]|uniref:rRNA-processing protein EBP2 n=1 Tax=Clavelina lepadiformis TaxID=159417 RepID=A0ABP0FPC5_CLALP